jgi:outer membrane protein assembly factor BamB
VWREKGIMESIPAGGHPLRSKTWIGSGNSGPVVADGRVFVMDRIKMDADPAKAELLNKADSPINANFERRLLSGTERLVCLDESDGRILWTHEYDYPYTTAGDYAIGLRVTPTVHEGGASMLGAEGHLLCLDAHAGKVIWVRDIREDFGIRVPIWGFAARPLIDGDRLICVAGGQGSTAVAFDRRMGYELWRARESRESGLSLFIGRCRKQ